MADPDKTQVIPTSDMIRYSYVDDDDLDDNDSDVDDDSDLG